jgi:hypothetical protein
MPRRARGTGGRTVRLVYSRAAKRTETKLEALRRHVGRHPPSLHLLSKVSVSMSKAIARPWDDAAAPAKSQAREAAEAACSAVPDGAEDGPVVIVKRRRTVGEPAASPRGAAHQAGAGDDKPARVFRVESVSAVQGDAADRSNGSAVEPPSEDGARAPQPPRRTRRRAPHGKVTIIRPAPAPAGAAQLQPAVANDHGVAALPLVVPGVNSRYDAVMAEIERLKRRAAVLKEAEARNAVRWIRKAISEHGLTAKDLGL